jgi:DNA-directed RNA polymerase subunit RPC12/RpoP
MERERGISLAQLAAFGRLVVVECAACPNRRLLKPIALGLPLATAVSVAGALLKCSECGSKRVLTFPESARDARRCRVR